MKNHLASLTSCAVLLFCAPSHADLPPAKAAADSDCATGASARSLLLQATAAPDAEAAQATRLEVHKVKDGDVAAAKVAARVVLVQPDGKRQEFSFGNPSGENIRARVKNGGAHLELKVAPDREALDRVKNTLEGTFKEHGIGGELAGEVLDALRNLDRLAAVQIRGLAVGPEPHAEEFDLEFGSRSGEGPLPFDRRMEEGGAQLELGVETSEQANDLLGLLLHAPETLQLLEESLRNPETVRLLNQIVSNPELMRFFESAAQDPELLGALRRGLEDPLISGLLTKGLNNESATNLLKLFGGAAKPKPAPEAHHFSPADQQPESTSPQETAEPDAEVEALRQELAKQRALLDQILRKLEP